MSELIFNQTLLSGLIMVRNVAIGAVSVGLFIGAIGFALYLRRLAGLPKESREYRELSYHMVPETQLRYAITILCLITLNVLFYAHFDMGKQCTHYGIAVWILYYLGRRGSEWYRSHRVLSEKTVTSSNPSAANQGQN